MSVSRMDNGVERRIVVRKRFQDRTRYLEVTMTTTSTTSGTTFHRTCMHTPECPAADAPDRDAAHVIAAHPEQGWSLLCNGVVVFEDLGDLLPDGRTNARPTRALLLASPHRASA